jgi:protein SCO1
MMTSIKKLQNQLKKSGQNSNIHFYSFTTLPEEDSPSELRDYAEAHQLNLSNWSLVTGDKAQIYRLGKTVFKADGSIGSQKKDTKFIHTSNLYVVDSQLRIRGIYRV